MNFYFIRHGATQNNQSHTFNGGGVDTPLTVTGQAEATALGQYLRRVTFTAAYVSPQQRAQTTARLVLAQNQQVTPDLQVTAGLREMNLGDWDGTPIAAHRNEPETPAYFDHPAQFNGDRIHAETYAQAAARGREVLQQIWHTHTSEATILVASHGLLLTSLLKTLRGTPLDEIRQDGLLATSSVTVMTTMNGSDFQVVDWAVKPV